MDRPPPDTALSPQRLLDLLRCDLFRYAGRSDRATFVRAYFREPGFAFTCWLRTEAWLLAFPRPRPALRTLARLARHRYGRRYGIEIAPQTKIAPGLCIVHHGGIVVSPLTVIGRNCTVYQGVTLGQTNRGERAGTPVVGDDVYLAPGAKVMGAVTVGSGAVIGANCVVSKDVPENGVMVASGARLTSRKGSHGYVQNTGYPLPSWLADTGAPGDARAATTGD